MTTERPEKPSLAASLSFGGGTSADGEDVLVGDGSTSDAHHDPALQQTAHKDAADDDDDSSEDFEFAFVIRDPDAFPSVTADEIFSGGQILPAYPVFNRDLLLPSSAAGETEAASDASDVAEQIPLGRLLIEEREARSASSSEEPEAVGEYCAWTPARCKKSASTGSSLRWRLRDLMVGRSHSDGKEKFVFLPEAPPPAKVEIANSRLKAAAAAGKGAKKAVPVAEMDVVTAHGLYYGKGTGEKTVKGPRRSFLPYRQELFGLFAPVNGLYRSHHPL